MCHDCILRAGLSLAWELISITHLIIDFTQKCQKTIRTMKKIEILRLEMNFSGPVTYTSNLLGLHLAFDWPWQPD